LIPLSARDRGAGSNHRKVIFQGQLDKTSKPLGGFSLCTKVGQSAQQALGTFLQRKTKNGCISLSVLSIIR
jgi:hypothetical protein